MRSKCNVKNNVDSAGNDIFEIDKKCWNYCWYNNIFVIIELLVFEILSKLNNKKTKTTCVATTKHENKQEKIYYTTNPITQCTVLLIDFRRLNAISKRQIINLNIIIVECSPGVTSDKTVRLFVTKYKTRVITVMSTVPCTDTGVYRTIHITKQPQDSNYQMRSPIKNEYVFA